MSTDPSASGSDGPRSILGWLSRFTKPLLVAGYAAALGILWKQAVDRYQANGNHCITLNELVADWQGLGALTTYNPNKLPKTQRAAKQGTLDAYKQYKLRKRMRRHQLVADNVPELLPKLQKIHEQEGITSVGDATEYEILEEGGMFVPKPDFYYDLYKPSNSKQLDYHNPFDFVELQPAASS